MAYVVERHGHPYVYVKLPDGRYRPFSRHPETGLYFRSGLIAQNWGRDKEIEFNKPGWVDPYLGAMTWDDLWEMWNPHGDGDLVTEVDDVTADFYNRLYNTHIGPKWGQNAIGDHLPTGGTKRAAVDRWLKALREGTVETGPEGRRRQRAYSPRTVTGIRKLMVLMLNDAVEERLLAINQLDSTKSRTGSTRGKRVDRVAPKTVRVKAGVTPEQALALAVNLHQVVGPGSLAGIGAFVRALTAFFSSLRPGEQAGLNPANCRVAFPAAASIHVHPKVGNLEEREKVPMKLKAPKGGLGRDVVLPQGLAVVLAAWLKYLEGEKPGNTIAFPSTTGAWWSRRDWVYRWNIAAAGGIHELKGPNRWSVAGIYVLERAAPGLEPKGARRAWNVWATEQGIPDIARETQLGHAMSDELQAAYSLMSAVLEDQIRTAFQALWTEAFAGYAGVEAIRIVRQFAPDFGSAPTAEIASAVPLELSR